MKRSAAVILLLFLAVLAAGCGNSKELDEYKDKMNTFFDNLSAYNESINAIDPNSEDAASQLLTQIDELAQEFSRMAGFEVPDDFSSVAGLAEEARDYMEQAASLYHRYFEEGRDAGIAETARECYARANKRIKYIITILHGEIPEGAQVTYEETTFGDKHDEDDASPAEESLPENEASPAGSEAEDEEASGE